MSSLLDINLWDDMPTELLTARLYENGALVGLQIYLTGVACSRVVKVFS